MAEEQAIRSELPPPPPPPPSELNHDKSKASQFWRVFGDSAGRILGFQKGDLEFLNFLFRSERLAVFLIAVAFILAAFIVTEPVAALLIIRAAAIFALLSNTFYFFYFVYIISQDRAYKDDHIVESTDEEETEQEEEELEFSTKESKEEVEAKDGSNKKVGENTWQEKASWKDSKEEVKAKDESLNKIDEENTGRQKAKLDSTLKEENDRKSFDKFHGWEEERSQLMYELGAAKASAEIYRELLHDLHHHQPSL